MSEPRTKAGRDMLRVWTDWDGALLYPGIRLETKPDEWRATIIAIEAEAATLSDPVEVPAEGHLHDTMDVASELRSIREAMHEATGAMAATLPVILAVREWRDTPFVGTSTERERLRSRLEQAILDAMDGLDEYAEQHPPTPSEAG